MEITLHRWVRFCKVAWTPNTVPNTPLTGKIPSSLPQKTVSHFCKFSNFFISYYFQLWIVSGELFAIIKSAQQHSLFI